MILGSFFDLNSRGKFISNKNYSPHVENTKTLSFNILSIFLFLVYECFACMSIYSL